MFKKEKGGCISARGSNLNLVPWEGRRGPLSSELQVQQVQLPSKYSCGYHVCSNETGELKGSYFFYFLRASWRRGVRAGCVIWRNLSSCFFATLRHLRQQRTGQETARRFGHHKRPTGGRGYPRYIRSRTTSGYVTAELMIKREKD